MNVHKPHLYFASLRWEVGVYYIYAKGKRDSLELFLKAREMENPRSSHKIKQNK